MTPERRLALITLALLFVTVTSTPRALACGPFSLEAIFVFTVHPEYPLLNYARGNLGVLHSSYARSYLYVAYRHLSGIDFNPPEQQALADLWKDRLDFRGEGDEQEWIKQWNTARAKVPGVSPAPGVDVYRHREKPNEYETYLNCQKDAFASASSTLEDRIKKYGAESLTVKQWVEAQDQVFANCTEGQHIPSSLTEGDSLSRADRTYQIAAANFYSGSFDVARRTFEAISGEADSPWQDSASYLIARTLLRKASLGPAETKQQDLAEAERHLNLILSAPKLTSFHAAARRLLSIVMLRLHPEQRLHELSEFLLKKDRAENLKQDLWDYTVLLDQLIGEGDKPDLLRSITADDLGDWILTFQGKGSDSVAHAVAKWQETHSTPWLIAALAKIDASHPRAKELLAEALKVAPDSPAYPTALFHTLRLDLEAGRIAEARRRLDSSLSQHRSAFNASSLNQLLNLRMALATSLNDFLTYAQRLPAGFSWNDDGREIPTDPRDEEEANRSLEGRAFFDIDAAQVLNQGLPLALLKRTAENKTLPAHLRLDLVQATWLRAILLGDYQTAEALAPTLKSLVPETSTLLDVFLSSPQTDAKRFSALYAWLKFPGLEPVVDAGVGRRTPLGEQDIYRDNWWCGAAFPPGATTSTDEDQDKPKALWRIDPKEFPVFLTQAERAEASREHAALLELGAAPNYLCRQVIQWGLKNADDPRVPEALHLAVKTTRYSCTDKETGRWSKAAYDLLHKRYPNSVWAKRTPYWFKD